MLENAVSHVWLILSLFSEDSITKRFIYMHYRLKFYVILWILGDTIYYEQHYNPVKEEQKK